MSGDHVERLEAAYATRRAKVAGTRPDVVEVLSEDLRAALAELKQLRAERNNWGIPAADYSTAWAELTGYVQEAVDDGGPLVAADLLAYMAELKRNAQAPVRDWMHGLMAAAPQQPERGGEAL